MKKNLVKSGLLITMVLLMLMAFTGTAAALHDVSVVRTITPTTVTAGDSFDVVLDVTLSGTIETTGDNAICSVIETYTETDWVMSNMVAAPEFTAFVNSTPGEYTWSTGLSELPLGNYQIAYTMTVPADEAAGDYTVSGVYGDTGHPAPGVATTGDATVTVETGPIVLNPGDDVAAALEGAVSGDTIYFNEGYYDLSGASTGYVYQKSLTLTGAGADVVTVDLGFGGWEFGYDSEPTADYDITIENINFDASKNSSVTSPPPFLHDNLAAGLYFRYADDVVVRNCTFANTTVGARYTDSVEFSDNVVLGVFRNSDVQRNFEMLDVGSVVVSGNDINGVYFEMEGATNAQIYDNTFADASEMGLNAALFLNGVTAATVSDNTFTGNSAGIELSGSDGCTITENDFSSNDAAMEILGVTGTGNAIYLNNFVDNTANYANGGSNTGSVSYVSGSAVSYVYNGQSLSNVLGNYYSDYTGEDADSNGIIDTAYTAVAGDDTAPLITEFEDGVMENLVVLADMTVDLVADETYVFIPYNEPSNEYTVDSMTDLGLLMASGLEYEVADSWYESYGSFLLDSLDGVENEPWSSTSKSWALYINGELAAEGLGHANNTLNNGDKVSFYYTTTDSVTYEPILGEAMYAIHLTANEVDYPVLAQRDIANQNFYTTALSNMGQTSTQVTVTLTAREVVDSLSLEETIPAGWTLTPSDNGGAIFKANLTDDTRFEWVWADETMASGESKTITYTLTLPTDAAADDYYVTGTSSVFVSGADVNDIPVVGEELVRISSNDWNPWNDFDSEGGEYITTAELQSAVNCWLNDLPTPTTGETVTTDRLQMLVYYWVNDLTCPEGADN